MPHLPSQLPNMRDPAPQQGAGNTNTGDSPNLLQSLIHYGPDDPTGRTILDSICVPFAFVFFAAPLTVFWQVVKARQKQEGRTHSQTFGDGNPSYDSLDSLSSSNTEQKNEKRRPGKSRPKSRPKKKVGEESVSEADASVGAGSGSVKGDGSGSTVIQMPPLAVNMQALQCWAYTVYACGLGEVTVMVPSAWGCLIGVIMVILYPRFWDRRRYYLQYVCQLVTALLLGAMCIVLAVVARKADDKEAGGDAGTIKATEASNSYAARENTHWGVTVTSDEGATRIANNKPPGDVNAYWNAIGVIALVAGTVMICHPLPTFLEVYRTGNVELMGSLTMNAVTAFSSFCWTLNAFLYIGSWQLGLQNAFGHVTHVIALILRWKIASKNAFGHVTNVGALILRWKIASNGGAPLAEGTAPLRGRSGMPAARRSRNSAREGTHEQARLIGGGASNRTTKRNSSKTGSKSSVSER